MHILTFIVFLCLSPITLAENEVLGEFLGNKDVEIPTWFKTSFLDFSEDLSEANEKNRHVMVYFHQNGCPYCAKLVEDNFHNPALVKKLKQHFDAIETNMWGDRELTDWRGEDFTEKEFSAFMKIQFTPTLVFLDPKGEIVLRLNGYQSSEKMHKALDYVAEKRYRKQSFANYLSHLKQNKGEKLAKLNSNQLFDSAPHILTRHKNLPAERYLAVFFEESNCPECDTFHQTLMPLDDTKKLLKPMQLVQLNALSDEKIITPDGRRTTAKQWYEDLKLTYSPAVVLFDKHGQEVIRKDAFFKAYHFHGILSYVLSGAFQQQPNFQRYLEEKSDKLRAKGVDVNIWK